MRKPLVLVVVCLALAASAVTTETTAGEINVTAGESTIKGHRPTQRSAIELPAINRQQTFRR